MENVKLNMTDEITGKKVERIIDKTNAMKSGSDAWILGDEKSQRERLERWINERGNDQHETILTLNNWEFV